MVASKEANRITRLEKMVKNQKDKLVQLDKDRLELEEIGFQKAVKEDEIRKIQKNEHDASNSTGNKVIESKKALQELMVKEYDFKNLGVPSLMIGVNIMISDGHIKLNQSHYIRELADKFGQLSAAKVYFPDSVHGCLGSATGEVTPLTWCEQALKVDLPF